MMDYLTSKNRYGLYVSLITMICKLNVILASELPILHFEKLGNYSIHADVTWWTKVSLYFWKSEDVSFFPAPEPYGTNYYGL